MCCSFKDQHGKPAVFVLFYDPYEFHDMGVPTMERDSALPSEVLYFQSTAISGGNDMMNFDKFALTFSVLASSSMF